MTSIQGQSGQEESNLCFGFWLTVSENIDFITQYLANNGIFGNALVDVSCKKYLIYTSEENGHLTFFLIMSLDLYTRDSVNFKSKR